VLHQALDKQKQKTDEEHRNNSMLKKDNQSLMDSCEDLEKRRQRFEHDIHTKDTRIACLEGQLAQAKKQLAEETNKVRN
jgi:centromere protein F